MPQRSIALAANTSVNDTLTIEPSGSIKAKLSYYRKISIT